MKFVVNNNIQGDDTQEYWGDTMPNAYQIYAFVIQV